MSYRISTAILAGTFGLSASALAGTMRVNLNASVTVEPQVTLTNAYMVVGGFIYTKGAPFDQLLQEADGTNTNVLSLGTIAAGSTVTRSTSMVASTYSSASYVGQPASATGLDLGVLVIGTYGTGDTLGEGNGVVISYEPIAGNAIIQAGSSWAANSFPMFVPTSPNAGTVGLAVNVESQATLFNTLRTGTAADISSVLRDAMYELSNPMDGSGESGIGIPYYSDLDTATRPSGAARYHRDQKFIDRPAKLVKFNSAADGGNATINVSDPLPNTLGDFDGDGLVDATDVDLMLRGTVVSGAGTRLYDVNDDNVANLIPNTPGSDVDVWVRTLKSTEYGDATLDGVVNFDDLLILAKNYNGSFISWAQGNFDGDGSVDFDDLLSLAQHYGFGSLQTAGNADFASDWALAQSLVPEPASILTAALALTPAARRRR